MTSEPTRTVVTKRDVSDRSLLQQLRQAKADAELVERELPTYRDDEEVILTAAALRVLIERARGRS